MSHVAVKQAELQRVSAFVYEHNQICVDVSTRICICTCVYTTTTAFLSDVSYIHPFVKPLLAHAFWVQCYSHPLVCSESWHKFLSKQITCVVRGAKRNLKIAMIISEGARSWWIYIHFLHLWDQDPGYPHQAQLPFANFHRRPNTWWVLGAMLSNRRPEVDEEKSLDQRDLDPMEDYKKSTLPSWCLRFDSWKTVVCSL